MACGFHACGFDALGHRQTKTFSFVLLVFHTFDWTNPQIRNSDFFSPTLPLVFYLLFCVDGIHFLLSSSLQHNVFLNKCVFILPLSIFALIPFAGFFNSPLRHFTLGTVDLYPGPQWTRHLNTLERKNGMQGASIVGSTNRGKVFEWFFRFFMIGGILVFPHRTS